MPPPQLATRSSPFIRESTRLRSRATAISHLHIMVKRKLQDVQSEDEYEPSSSRQAKRPRTDKHAHANDSGRRRLATLSEEDNSGQSDEEGSDSGMSSDEFDEEIRERIARQMRDDPNRIGGMAESGIITRLSLFNFMCHKQLSFDLGPRMNFIIGHNGSGKSAILTALTVALGGKASSTSRANNLQMFIKEGQSIAEVVVVVKNEGSEAFKPDVYGKAITITRRFTREGSSSYKIKGSRSEKTISTKREELSAICGNFNIQVDNPMNVLSQDTARQFLSASKPRLKYELFARGTLLTQLNYEYDLIDQNIARCKQIMDRKRPVLDELKRKLTEAEERYNEAEKAQEQVGRIDVLRQEKAWSVVSEKEKVVMKQRTKIREADELLQQVVARFEAEQVKFDEASALVVRLEAEVKEEEEGYKPLEDQRKRNNDTIRTKRALLQEITNDERQMNQSLGIVNDTLADLETQIADEIQKLEENTHERRQHIEQSLADAKVVLDDTEAAHVDLEQQEEDLHEQARGTQDRLNGAEEDMRTIGKLINDYNNHLQQLRQTRVNKLHGFGRDIPRLLQAIRQQTWLGETPFGPLGMYVDVKAEHGDRWAQVLRLVIGNMMTSFVITNHADRPKLMKLLKQTRNDDATIVISQRDIFDYSFGEPPADVLTVLRVLEITDEFVKRVLINSNSIERNLLADTRMQAPVLLNRLHRSGTVYTADLFTYIRYGDGGERSIPFEDRNRHAALFLGSSPEHVIRGLEEQVRDAEGRRETVSQRIIALNADVHRLDVAIRRIEGQLNASRNAVRLAQNSVTEIESELHEDDPATLQALRDTQRDALAEKENIKDQFKALENRRALVQQGIDPLLEQNNLLRTRILAFEERKEELTASVIQAAQSREEAKLSKDHYERKLLEGNTKVEELRGSLEAQQQELETFTAQATELGGSSVRRPRLSEAVEREIQALEQILAANKARQVGSVDDIKEEVERASLALEAASRDFSGLDKLNKALGLALDRRLKAWEKWRHYTALRTKFYFQEFLSKRGYFGKAMFYHTGRKLDIEVQTEDQVGTQGHSKAVRSLSGGEKSFSTICLLLSLWRSIPSPIRCLDEFDVFMDAVNRRISLSMLTEAARYTPGTQYIIITPQDMNGVKFGDEVKVLRMNDPERGHGPLPSP